MDLFACGELLDDPPSPRNYGAAGWMTGFELKGKQRMISYTQIIEKGISDYFCRIVLFLCL